MQQLQSCLQGSSAPIDSMIWLNRHREPLGSEAYIAQHQTNLLQLICKGYPAITLMFFSLIGRKFQLQQCFLISLGTTLSKCSIQTGTAC